MKIGINASFLRKPDTGIGQVTRGFIDELKKKDSDENEYFLYLEKEIAQEFPKNFHIRVYSPKIWRRDDLLRKIFFEKFWIPRQAKKDHCDIFISLYQCPTIFSKNIRHKILVHDMIWKIFPEYLDNWRKKLYASLSYKATRRADKIFTVSEWSKKDVQKYLQIPDEKIRVVYPSVDQIFFEPFEHEDDNRILEKYGVYGRYIFYIGGFDFRKNVSGLLRAFKIMTEKHEIAGVNLVLGGEDKSRYSRLFTNVKREINELQLENRVNLTGFVDQKDLPALYRQSELYVLPTFYEGFGLMVLEAMASGAPVAVSRSSSLPEVGGDAVLYFNPYDEEEMAKVMSEALQSNKLKSELSEKGKERAENFQWHKFTEKILET